MSCLSQSVLAMLELDDFRDEIIGPPGTGLSSERRKRLTIGVEVRFVNQTCLSMLTVSVWPWLTQALDLSVLNSLVSSLQIPV